MAEQDDSAERNLDPTQKKLDDALEKGDVPKSQEVNTWFLLSAATLAIFVFGPQAAADIARILGGFIGNVGTMSVDGHTLIQIASSLGLSIASALALPILLLVIAALASNLVQHRFVFSTEQITPKWQKISPLSGFKRVFGKEALVNFVKGLLKLIIVSGVIFAVTWPERDAIASMLRADLSTMMPYVFILIMKLLAASLAVLMLIAIGDYFYQRYTWYERQRMSQQELKEEFKQTEGNPEIKAKIRSLRRERSRRRMMANVPNATVVITNPTHYAVALKYETGMPAPICVAKGVDAVALKIREVATKHEVTIVENPPLARALHATVEIDDPIPTEHFRAVAEVISYVMKLRRGLQRA